MNIIYFLRNGFYLILGIFIVFLGLQYGLYGLIINVMGDELHELTIEELYSGDSKTKRYVEISGALIWDSDLAYYDGEGNVDSYLYILTLPDTIESKKEVVIVESAYKITDLNGQEIKGLLKPFWYRLDEDIITILNYDGFEIAENNYYLDLDNKPRKWYWNLIILLFSGLFIFRLIEAIIKGVKERKTAFLASSYSNKAYALLSLNKYSEALVLVNKALDIEKSKSYIWGTRGETYYFLGKYLKCIEDMDKAISIEEAGNSFYIRGLAKIKLGRKQEGCSDLFKASKLGKLEAYEALKIL